MCEKKSLIVINYDNTYCYNFNKVDGFIYNSYEYSNYPSQTYSLNDLISLNYPLNKLKFLNIDRIIDEEEIDDLKEYLSKVYDIFDYFIYSDYSIYTLFKEMFGNIAINKLIYDSKTLVCSYQELDKIPTKSFISSELSYEEVQTIINNSSDKKLCLNVFGFHQIMYSKRPLLSLYNDYIKNKVFNKNKVSNKNALYDLKEELRDDKYKIIEKEKGCYIYAPYLVSYKKYLDNLSEKVFLIRINNAIEFIDNDNLHKVINKYIDYINEKEDINFEDVNLKMEIKEGFLTEKLYLLKGDNDE